MEYAENQKELLIKINEHINLSVEKVRGLNQVDENLLSLIKNCLPEDYNLENLSFEYMGSLYTLEQIGTGVETHRVGVGYSRGCIYWQLVANKDNPKSKQEFNLIIISNYSKYKYYFDVFDLNNAYEYKYYYFEPEFKILEVKEVPEVVIPKHEIVTIKEP